MVVGARDTRNRPLRVSFEASSQLRLVAYMQHINYDHHDKLLTCDVKASEHFNISVGLGLGEKGFVILPKVSRSQVPRNAVPQAIN